MLQDPRAFVQGCAACFDIINQTNILLCKFMTISDSEGAGHIQRPLPEARHTWLVFRITNANKVGIELGRGVSEIFGDNSVLIIAANDSPAPVEGHGDKEINLVIEAAALQG